MLSNKVLNNMWQVLLGQNIITIDLSASKLGAVEDLPFKLTTSSVFVDALAPGIASVIGNIPFSIRLRNVGAPEFEFDPDMIKMVFSFEFELWNADMTERWMKLRVNGLEASFTMRLDDKRTLWVDWVAFNFRDVRAEEYKDGLTKTSTTSSADTLLKLFKELIAWNKSKHPWGVGRFEIPENIAGIMILKDLEMQILQHYIRFAMDPIILEEFVEINIL